MASKKKSTKKNAPKAKNTAPKKAAKAAAKRPPKKPKKTAPPRLTLEAKQAMLKPGDDLNELVAEILTAWSRVARKVRVADVSSAKLASLLTKAMRASAREAALVAKQEAKLAPLSDARIIASDAVYRAALKVKRIADAVAASDADVAEAFAGVSERFRRVPSPKDEPAEG
jgi:hypothetical protein